MALKSRAPRLCDALDVGAVWPAMVQTGGGKAVPDIGPFSTGIEEQAEQLVPWFEERRRD